MTPHFQDSYGSKNLIPRPTRRLHLFDCLLVLQQHRYASAPLHYWTTIVAVGMVGMVGILMLDSDKISVELLELDPIKRR